MAGSCKARRLMIFRQMATCDKALDGSDEQAMKEEVDSWEEEVGCCLVFFR